MPRRSAVWRDLPQAFARRMAPAALAIALAIALAPPALFVAASVHGLRIEAELVAVDLADALSGLATRQPVLWRYNSQKVLDATRAVGTHAGVIEVRVEGCDGATWRVLPVRADASPALSATAPIRARGVVVARVRVAMGTARLVGAALAWLLVSGVAGTALGWFAYAFPRRVVRRQAQALSDAGAALESANARLRAEVDAAVTEVRALSARVTTTQDAERDRIARDLHDGVGQIMTALEVELAMARDREGERAGRIEAASALAAEAMAELRHIVRDARPAALDGSPLAEVMGALTETFEARTGVACAFRFTTTVDDDIGDEAAACLLRVAQEALANVTRHARATEVGVVLDVDADAISLRISDDGRGFDADARAPGVGLGSMRDRVRLVGGELGVRSTPGAGTVVDATIPREALARLSSVPTSVTPSAAEPDTSNKP